MEINDLVSIPGYFISPENYEINRQTNNQGLTSFSEFFNSIGLAGIRGTKQKTMK